jgi:zinc transport system ATP-binding protein
MDRASATAAAEIVFENVGVRLGGITILEGISAAIPAGGSTAIVGPNGAGKTTLLLAILGEIPFTGRIDRFCRGAPASPRVGYVPQRLAFDRGMPLTVMEFLLMGVQRFPLWLGRPKTIQRSVEELLRAVSCELLAHRPLGALSGGEMQRVLLALALQQRPELLLLDEPAAGVDPNGEALFCELLETLRRSHGFTQVMVSHDLVSVTHHATHVIGLNRRMVMEGKPREALNAENLAVLFGRHLGLVDAGALANGMGACSAPCCVDKSRA